MPKDRTKRPDTASEKERENFKIFEVQKITGETIIFNAGVPAQVKGNTVSGVRMFKKEILIDESNIEGKGKKATITLTNGLVINGTNFTVATDSTFRVELRTQSKQIVPTSEIGDISRLAVRHAR